MREVKECFVLSDKAKSLADLDPDKFQKGLGPLKEQVQGMTDPQLDSILGWRASHYDSLSWSWGNVSIDDSGVWLGAGGLPEEVCLGSVRETASLIKKMGGPGALPIPHGDRRAKDNIPGILRVASVISKERSLSVIADRGGTHRPISRCRTMRWDLCDGSVRAVGLALARVETLNAFFGA